MTSFTMLGTFPATTLKGLLLFVRWLFLRVFVENEYAPDWTNMLELLKRSGAELLTSLLEFTIFAGENCGGIRQRTNLLGLTHDSSSLRKSQERSNF
jgi:hypothetical protein